MYEVTTRKLNDLLCQMAKNSQEPGEVWRNLKLATDAFHLLTGCIPLRDGQHLTPYTRIRILSSMLEEIDELSVPRFALQVMHYQNTLFELIDEKLDRNIDMAYDEFEGDSELYRRPLQGIREKLAHDERRLQQYADLEIPMPIWCKRYDHYLLFDPVERTFEWEMQIYDVERECHETLKGMPQGSGTESFYWAAMKAAWVKRGIEWKNPQEMNPRIRFD